MHKGSIPGMGQGKKHEQSVSKAAADPKTRSHISSRVEPSKLSRSPQGSDLSGQAQAAALELCSQCRRLLDTSWSMSGQERALTSWESSAGHKLGHALLGTSLLSPVRPEN